MLGCDLGLALGMTAATGIKHDLLCSMKAFSRRVLHPGLI